MKKSIIVLLTVLTALSASVQGQSIKELSFFAPLPSIFEAKYLNNHLFISQQGIRVMDVSNPFNPQLIGQATYPGSFAYQIAVQGNRAYMAAGGGGHFAVYNITNFSSPSFQGSVQIPATEFLLFGDMVPFGNYVYMTGHDSLYVLNVANVNNPLLVQTQYVPGFQAGEMAIHNNSLFIVTNISVVIFDLSNPSAPALTTQITNRHATHTGIALDPDNNRIFLPWVSGLQDYIGHDAYNISNPSQPVHLFSDSTDGGSGDFGLTNYFRNVLYITRGGSVTAWDVSSLNHHFITSFTGQNVANASVSLEVKDSIFYNIRRSGVEILRYSGPFPTIVINQNVNSNGNSVQVMLSGSKELIITGTGESNAEIKIYNILGQIIYSAQNVNLSLSQKISLANFASGIYFLRVTGNNLVTDVQKFVVQ